MMASRHPLSTVLERAFRTRDEDGNFRSIEVWRQGFLTYLGVNYGLGSQITSFADPETALSMASTLIEDTHQVGGEVRFDYTRIPDPDLTELLTNLDPDDFQRSLVVAANIDRLYQASGEEARATVLYFARRAPFRYGYWGGLKWLFKEALRVDDFELATLMCIRLDRPIDLTVPLAIQGMPFMGHHPSLRTLEYVRRRARRYITDLATRAPETYVKTAHSILLASSSVTSQAWDLYQRPLTERILDDPFDLPESESDGEDVGTSVWSAHVELLRSLVGNVYLPMDIREFAARNLIDREPLPQVEDDEFWLHLTHSFTPRLRTVAISRRLEAALASTPPDPARLGEVFADAPADIQKQISDIAMGSDIGWVQRFLGALFADRPDRRDIAWLRPSVQCVRDLYEREQSEATHRQLTITILGLDQRRVHDIVYRTWKHASAAEILGWLRELQRDNIANAARHQQTLVDRLVELDVDATDLVSHFDMLCQIRDTRLTRKLIAETPLRENEVVRGFSETIATRAANDHTLVVSLCVTFNRALLTATSTGGNDWQVINTSVADALILQYLKAKDRQLLTAAWEFIAEHPDWIDRNPGAIDRYIADAIGAGHLSRLFVHEYIESYVRHSPDVLAAAAAAITRFTEIPDNLVAPVVALQSHEKRLQLMSRISEDVWQQAGDIFFNAIDADDPVEFWEELTHMNWDSYSYTGGPSLLKRLQAHSGFARQFRDVFRPEWIARVGQGKGVGIAPGLLDLLGTMPTAEVIGHGLVPVLLRHPLPAFREAGLRVAFEGQAVSEMIIDLLPETDAGLVRLAEKMLGEIPIRSDNEAQIARLLLQSEDAALRQRGIEFAAQRVSTVPPDVVFDTVRLTGTAAPSPLWQRGVNLFLSDDPPVDVARLVLANLLAQRGTGQEQGMLWAQQHPEEAAPVLVDVAREGDPRLQDWALELLVNLAITGVNLPGFELIGPVERSA